MTARSSGTRHRCATSARGQAALGAKPSAISSGWWVPDEDRRWWPCRVFCWEKHPRSTWLALQRALTRPCFSPQVWGRRRTAAGTRGSPRSAPDTAMVTARGWLLLLLLLLGASAGLGEGHPLLVLSLCCPQPGDRGNAMGGHGEGGHHIHPS